MTESVARKILIGILGRLRHGSVELIEGDRRTTFGAGHPAATVRIVSPAVWPRLLTASRGLAETYMEGLWETPDLTAVIRVGALNMAGVDRVRRRFQPIVGPYQRAAAAIRRNTPQRSRRDIAAHYDLGNELFRLMLDPTMTYSCAFFERPGMTLEEASIAKLDRVCRKLALGPGDHVLEIGTGWGSFALHAAGTYGCRVTTTTISREQHAHAVERVRRAGLEDRVTVLFQDYRTLTGTYDKLVSIEMIEAVGWQDFGTYFATCSRLLTDNGAMLLQAITIDDRAYDVEKAKSSFINKYIFPNGCLPSQAIIARCLARWTDLRTVHLEDITSHYPETLRQWRENFQSHADRLAGLGYDERFRRLWNLYLAYCEAGFIERRIGDVQLLLAKPSFRDEDAASLAAAGATPLAAVAG